MNPLISQVWWWRWRAGPGTPALDSCWPIIIPRSVRDIRETYLDTLPWPPTYQFYPRLHYDRDTLNQAYIAMASSSDCAPSSQRKSTFLKATTIYQTLTGFPSHIPSNVSPPRLPLLIWFTHINKPSSILSLRSTHPDQLKEPQAASECLSCHQTV